VSALSGSSGGIWGKQASDEDPHPTTGEGCSGRGKDSFRETGNTKWNEQKCLLHASALFTLKIKSEFLSFTRCAFKWSSRMKIPMTLPLQLGLMGSQQKSA
jgi:hypothetical protein